MNTVPSLERQDRAAKPLGSRRTGVGMAGIAQPDACADLADRLGLFEHLDGLTRTRERQRGGQNADATAGDVPGQAGGHAGRHGPVDHQ